MGMEIIYIIVGAIVLINIMLFIIITKNKKRNDVIKGDTTKASNSSPVYKQMVQENVADEYSKTEVLGSKKEQKPEWKMQNENLNEGMNDKTEVLGGISNFTTQEKAQLKEQYSVDETMILAEVPNYIDKKVIRTIEYKKADDLELYKWNEEEVIVIGRDPENSDLTITSDNFIGRIHALIYKKSDKYFLVDLNSKNGTFIDNIALKGQKEIALQKPFQLGKTQLVIK